MIPFRHILLLCATSAAFVSLGCQRHEVSEYTAPKEVFPEMSNIRSQMQQARAGSSAPHGHHHHTENPATPEIIAGPLHYWLPDGWEEQPLSSMRKASFAIRDEEGGVVDVSVMSFPGDVGGLHANVNRWREQIGLAGLSDPEVEAAMEHLIIGGRPFSLIDIAGAVAPGSPASRVVGAIHAAEGETWFFKMSGPDMLTAQHRSRFIAFIESVEF